MNKKIVDYVSILYNMRFPHYSNNLKKNENTKIIYDICKSSKVKIYSVEDIVNGLADDAIIQQVEEIFKETKNDLWVICKNLRNHVLGVISDFELIEDNDMNDYIINQIVAGLVEFYDYREMNEGVYVEKIKYSYHQEKIFLRHLLLKNIQRVVNSDIDIYESVDNNLSQTDIEIYVLDKLFPDVNYKMIMALNLGKYDKKINMLIKEYISRNKKPKVDVTSYIGNVIYNYDDALTSRELEYYTSRVEKILRDQGIPGRVITDEKEKQVILNCFDELKRRRNSIKDAREKEKVREERIKYQTKKRRMHITVLSLLLVATLSVGSWFASFIVREVKDQRESFVITQMYENASEKLNGDRYARVCTKYSDQFVDNAKFVVEDYKKCSQLGEDYKYMGFFEFYMHVGENRLAVMDSLLEYLQEKYHLDFGTRYYIQFMYDRLVDLGCEEIKDEKYLRVIEEYKDVAYFNENDNKTTMDCMNKEQVECIKEIKDLYIKYSASCYKELAENFNFDDECKLLSGRKI